MGLEKATVTLSPVEGCSSLFEARREVQNEIKRKIPAPKEKQGTETL